MVPRIRENKIIDELYNILEELVSFTKNFQSDKTKIAEVRSILEEVITDIRLRKEGLIQLQMFYCIQLLSRQSQKFRTTMRPTWPVRIWKKIVSLMKYKSGRTQTTKCLILLQRSLKWWHSEKIVIVYWSTFPASDFQYALALIFKGQIYIEKSSKINCSSQSWVTTLFSCQKGLLGLKGGA